MSKTGRYAGIRFTDLVASQKILKGDWFVVPHEGKIYNKQHREILGSLSRGYLRIKTEWDGIELNVPYHRAVWIGAHGGLIPEDRHLQIDHINGDKQDNRISNLRLVTPRENHQNPNAPTGAKPGEDNHWAKLTNEQAEEIRRRYAESQSLPKGCGRLTQQQLAIEYGVSHYAINRIVQVKSYQPVTPAYSEIQNTEPIEAKAE